MAIYESQKIRDYSEKKSSPFSELLNLVETFSSINKQEQAQTMSSLENILKLSNSSVNQEQIANAQSALKSIARRSSINDSTNIAHSVVQNNLTNKKFEIDRFTNSVEQASSIINDPNFLDKADEWRNLEDLRKNKVNQDGSYKYESVGEMLSDEYSAIETLYNNVNSGLGKGYRYNKNIDFDDDDVKRKIGEYKNRLDKAIQANLGDGIITLDEAQLIMSGVDKSEFKTYITAKKNEVKDLIGDQQSIVTFYKKAIAGETGDEMFAKFMESFWEHMSEEQQANIAKRNIPALQDQLLEEEKNLTSLYGQHKYWTGGDYASPSALDSGELGEIADENINTINVSSLEKSEPETETETAVTEEDLKLYEKEKKKEEVKKKEIYTKEEKELIDSYDLDMARLEEIDKSLKGPGYALTTADRKKLGLEKKRIKKKWKSPGGGIVRDAQGNIIGDYRTGLEKKVFDLKQGLK